MIAVTGHPGAGKTSLLAMLATWSQTQGRPADGFLSRARNRPNPHMGADGYDLEWALEGHVTPFADRTASSTPAYHFHPDAFAETHAWAENLSSRPEQPLVVLDEFGQLEAAGEGHVKSWPLVAAAEPEVVVLAVREGLVDEIAVRLGQPFDLIVDAQSPEAWETLRTACREHRDWMRVGAYGAGSGGIEMGMGSALHAVKTPGRGLILSSLQTAVMVAAGSGLGHRRRVVWIPFIAAGLKALSPAGNRLRPMLAITVQGLLFGGATTVLGWNAVGVALGSWLVGAWAAAQGAVLQYLLVGDQLLRAYESLTVWLTDRFAISTPGLWTAIFAWVVIWGLGTMATGLFIHHRRSLPHRFQELMARRMEGLGHHQPLSRRRAAWLGLRDLARPVFWIPLLIIGAIVLAAGAPWADVFWMAARAVTIGFLVFSLARGFQPRKLVNRLRRRGHWGPALALEKALRRHSRDGDS